MEKYQFPKIKDEISFEEFSRDFFKLLYPYINFQLYGKKGQSQFGIDGCSTEKHIYFQSKHKSKDTIKDKDIVGELNSELKKAKPKIKELSKDKTSKYLYITTHKQSTIIQDEAKKISTKEITVEYWGWETIESSLNDLYKKENIDFFFKYYPDIAKNLNDNVIPKQLSIKSAEELEHFVGRKAELNLITKELDKNKAILVHGIGGIGKSSIANYYLFTNKEAYDYYGLFEGMSEFISDLKFTLNLKSELESDILKEAVVKLRNLKGTKLLIIDNISDIDNYTNIINILLSLKDYGFTIIFTSRETSDYIKCFELDVMDDMDAKKLFNSIYEVENSLLEEILGYLDYHTFFIEKTAKTLKAKDSLTPEKIKEYFENGEFSKIKTSRKDSFKKYLDELFSIDALDDEEILILKQITIFPSAFISFEDLRLILQKKDESEFEDILNYLTEKGWLTKYNDGNRNGYKLHQINKEYLFVSHKPDFEDLKIPIKFYNIILDQSADLEVSLYHKNRLIYFESLYKSLKDLNIQTGEVFVLLYRISNVYLHLGKINFSLEISHTALKISNNIENLHKMYLAQLYNTLAQIYMRISDRKNTLKYMEESVLIFEKYLTDHSSELAIQYSNLAHAYKTFGQIDKSLKYFDKAIDLLKSKEDDYEVSSIYKGIAEVYQIKRDYPNGLKFFQKALNLRKKTLKDDNPLIGQSYNDLGFMYVNMDQRDKALPLYIEAIKRYEETLGENHIDTANIYNNLGELYRYTMQHDKALPYIKKAMIIREKELGFHALDTAMSYNTLGVYFADIKQYNDSIVYLNKALNILNSKLEPTHDYIIQTKYNIDYTYSLMNRKFGTSIDKKIGRNSPCPCGSEKKYKRCCGTT